MATQEERLIRKYANLQRRLQGPASPPSSFYRDGHGQELSGRRQEAVSPLRHSKEVQSPGYGADGRRRSGPRASMDDAFEGIEDRFAPSNRSRAGNSPNTGQRHEIGRHQEPPPTEDFNQAVEDEMERQRKLLNDMLREYRTHEEGDAKTRRSTETPALTDEREPNSGRNQEMQSPTKSTSVLADKGLPRQEAGYPVQTERLGILPWNERNDRHQQKQKKLQYKRDLEQQIKERQTQKHSPESQDFLSRRRNQDNFERLATEHPNSNNRVSQYEAFHREEKNAPISRGYETAQPSTAETKAKERSHLAPVVSSQGSVPANLSSAEIRSQINNGTGFRRKHIKDPQTVEEEERVSKNRAEQARMLAQQLNEIKSMKEKEKQVKRREEYVEEQRIKKEQAELAERYRHELFHEENGLDSERVSVEEAANDCQTAEEGILPLNEAKVDPLDMQQSQYSNGYKSTSLEDSVRIYDSPDHSASPVNCPTKPRFSGELLHGVENRDPISEEIAVLQEQQNQILKQLQEQALMMQKLQSSMQQVKQKGDLESLQNQQQKLAELMNESEEHFKSLLQSEHAHEHQMLTHRSGSPFDKEQRQRPPLWRPHNKAQESLNRDSVNDLRGSSDWQTAGGIVSRLTRADSDSDDLEDSGDLFDELPNGIQQPEKLNVNGSGLEQSLQGDSMLVFLPDTHPEMQQFSAASSYSVTKSSEVSSSAVVDTTSRLSQMTSNSSIPDVSDLGESNHSGDELEISGESLSG